MPDDASRAIPEGPFARAAASIRVPDPAAMAAAAARHDILTKPQGSLGSLEVVGARLAGIARQNPPPIPDPAAVAVFAADHGVLGQGVSPWPAEVTAQMVANFSAGGAAVNVLARHVGASVTVVDVGVAADLGGLPGVVAAKVRPGTADLVVEPAMRKAEAVAALDVGARVADDLIRQGARCLITGDMGIGNTTASAALIASWTGRPAREVTGRGTGIDDDRLARKIRVIEKALERHAASAAPADPLATLASLGGLEIAAIAGFIVAGAAAGVPILLDGVIAAAAALAADALAPGCIGSCFAGHRSAEPGASVALGHLALEPLVDLGLRLGEGTGACLALPLLQAAARLLGEMATFTDAGVADKHD